MCDQPAAPEEFFLWPEHVPVFVLWQRLQTQWRVAPWGPTGLDYAGVHATLQMQGIPRKQHADLLHEIQLMERATLHTWRDAP